MKTSLSPDFIDYWDHGPLWCYGVRVHSSGAFAAIMSEPGQGPDEMQEILPSEVIPVDLDMLAKNKIVAIAVAAHVQGHRSSDLLDLITGKITFEQARAESSQTYQR